MGQKNCKPQPGDLIEIDRTHHQHWALYMGNGYVISLTPAGKQSVKLEKHKGPHKVALFTRTVTMERLKKVVRHNKWRVNNKSDQCQTPLPVKEIIQSAEVYIGKEITYCSFGRNCEHFVKKLRYGAAVSGQLRAFVGGELQNLDRRDDKDYPKPGDMIEMKWRGYQHWALYVGNGYVIHVTAVDEGVASLSSSNEKILIVKVTKEVLKEVVGNDAWAVNNKYDQCCRSLPADDIIQHAEGFVGRELVYDVFEFESEDFVTKLRYGGQLRAFVDGELHILDTRDDEDSPMPGDLIEIKRPLYQHWAIYVGGGYVIHVTAVDENSPPMSVSSVTLLTREAKVKKELMEKAVGNDKWSVNNKYDQYRNPFPAEEIIRRAECQIGRVVLYRLFYKNCEHFVTKLRYGDAFSEQAWRAIGSLNNVSGIGSSGVGALALLSAAPSGALLTTFGVGALAAGVFACNNIVHNIHCAKFRYAGRDMLQQKCC